MYQFPIVTKLYAEHLVEEMEHYGQWSSGANDVSAWNKAYWFIEYFIWHQIFNATKVHHLIDFHLHVSKPALHYNS